MTRTEVLETANKMVTGQREKEYGAVENNFACIAELWSAYKGADFTPLDVAMMMTLLKLGRIKTGTAKNDSFIDAAGYIACGGEIATEEKTKTPQTFDWEELRRRWWAFIHKGQKPMPPLPAAVDDATHGICCCVKTYAQCAGAQPCPFHHNYECGGLACSGWVRRNPERALEILRKMVDDIDE